MNDLIDEQSMKFPTLGVVLSALPASVFFFFAAKSALQMRACKELSDVCEE